MSVAPHPLADVRPPREGRVRTDVRAFARFAGRDLVVVALTAGVVAWDARLAAARATGALTAAVGVVAGVLFAFASFLAHEWGHWLGAVRAGGVVHPPRRLASFFLFYFDTVASDRRQFLAMSYGGYAATVAALAVLAAWARLDAWSGRTALVLAGAGMAVTAALELPTTVRVLRGAPLPEGFAFVGPSATGPTSARGDASGG